MSSIWDWIDEEKSHSWPCQVPTSDVVSLVLGLIKVSEGPAIGGDADARRLLPLLDAWLIATRNHERNGQNWLKKHGQEVVLLVRKLFPELLGGESGAERYMEGAELVGFCRHLFKTPEPGKVVYSGSRDTKGYKKSAPVQPPGQRGML